MAVGYQKLIFVWLIFIFSNTGIRVLVIFFGSIKFKIIEVWCLQLWKCWSNIHNSALKHKELRINLHDHHNNGNVFCCNDSIHYSFIQIVDLKEIKK